MFVKGKILLKFSLKIANKLHLFVEFVLMDSNYILFHIINYFWMISYFYNLELSSTLPGSDFVRTIKSPMGKSRMVFFSYFIFDEIVAFNKSWFKTWLKKKTDPRLFKSQTFPFSVSFYNLDLYLYMACLPRSAFSWRKPQVSITQWFCETFYHVNVRFSRVLRN